MPIDIVVPDSAPAGSTVKPMLYISKEYAGRTMKFYAYWVEGTGYSSYNKLVNRQGISLSSGQITVPSNGATIPLGSYVQPSIGSMVGVFVNDVFYYDDVPVPQLPPKEGVKSWSVSAEPSTVSPGDYLNINVKATLYSASGTLKVAVDMFGRRYESDTVRVKSTSVGITLPIQVPADVGSGTYTGKVSLYYNGKLVGSKSVSVTVEVIGPPVPPVPPKPPEQKSGWWVLGVGAAVLMALDWLGKPPKRG